VGGEKAGEKGEISARLGSKKVLGWRPRFSFQKVSGFNSPSPGGRGMGGGGHGLEARATGFL